MNNKIPTYQPTDACKECKGECCKNMGCHFSPSDFEEISFEYLKSKIEEGYISIDWWDEEDGSSSYFLRMRNFLKRRLVKAPIVDPSWGGRCVLLTNDGCPLPFEKRPLGARALKPNANGYCTSEYKKYECKEEWIAYKDVLVKLVEYFSEKE